MDILKSRVKKLNQVEAKSGKSVVYLMSRDQRVHDNHTLISTLKHAEVANLEPIVLFNLYPSVKNRTYNHYEWMIGGLMEVEQELNLLGIKFILYLDMSRPSKQRFQAYLENIKELEPAAVYFDFSPLKGPTNLQNYLSQNIDAPCYVVDTHNIVPVWLASEKEEYAAATFRPKIYRQLQNSLQEPEPISSIKYPKTNSISNINWEEVVKNIKLEKTSNYTPIVKPGSRNAINGLNNFMKNKLKHYSDKRNLPTEEFQSNLGAYLHFGQISSLRVALEVLKFAEQKQIIIDFNPSRNKAAKVDEIKTEKDRLKASIEAFLEELIVRKELCDNFCYYNKNYDNKLGGRGWALNSLKNHEPDKRDYIYTFEQLEGAETHDVAWNAAQTQMVRTGKMHGYMRMYWAKKILEWSENVDIAIDYAIRLNDMYELDGCDPNGYVGILWSMVGLHDRPWFEREIFGQIRYMNYDGLKRKFDVELYISSQNLH